MGSLGPLQTTAFVGMIKTVGKVPAAWMRPEGECPHCHGAGVGFTTDLSCPLCGGRGILYTSMTLPTSGATGGKIAFQQARIGKSYAPVQLQDGDVICSYLASEYPLDELDRLLLPTRQSRFSQRIVRGTGSADTLARTPVLTIQSVYTAAGAVPVARYTISDNQSQIVFNNGTGQVNAGTQYTVSYFYRPEYVVVQGSIHHREQASNGDYFPSSCVLRLWKEQPLDGS